MLVSDVLGRPFPEIMRATVLEPIGMGRSAYEQPLSEARARNAAVGYRGNETAVAGRWHTYPELAAAGLWTTPSDLARFAIELQRSLRGESNRVLSQQMTRQMLTVVKDGYGLGLALAGDGPSARFSHGGANEGFRCILVAFNETGQGAVVMTNSDLGGAVASEILRAIAREYGWSSNQPTERPLLVVDPAKLATYAGDYRVERPGGGFTAVVTFENGRLLVQPPGQLPERTIALSDSTFALEGDGTEVTFIRGADGSVDQMIIAPQGQRLTAQRVKR
jgi:CubicO group peptidase (beta-lactamase class C family)